MYHGVIDSLDLSPDGSELLIGYNPVTGATEAGVLLLDLTTEQVSVPAIVAAESAIMPLGDEIVGTIREPRWSPDGQWIIVTEGFNSVFGGSLGTDPALYAVPAGKTRTILTTQEPTDAILVQSEDANNRGTLVNHWSWATTYFWTR